MRRFLAINKFLALLGLCTALSLTARAQNGGPPIGTAASGSGSLQQSSGAPSGGCTALQTDVDNTTGHFYTCGAGSWVLIDPATTLPSLPTSPSGIAQVPTSTPSGGVGGAVAWSVPGVPIDAQTGTTVTVPVTDDVHFLTVNNASPVAIAGFALANNYAFSGENLGAGLATFTPASGTVNGAATQIIPKNWMFFHYTDNTNTFMPVLPTIGAFVDCNGSGKAETFTAATGAFGCNTISGGGGLGDPGANGVVFRSALNTTAPATRTNIDALSYVAGGGTANAQTVTLSPAVTSLTNGLLVRWTPAAANTANTVTLAVNGLAPVNIVGPNGATSIQPNDIVTSRIAIAIYDGTNFELQNRQTPNFTGSGVFSGGLTIDTQNSSFTNGLGFGNTANQAITGGPGGPSMLRGALTITNPATSATETFPTSGQTYTSQPACALGPVGSLSVTGTPFIDASSSNLILKVDVPTTPTSSITIFYVCVGNPN